MVSVIHASFLALQGSVAADSLPYAQLTAGGTHTCALARSGKGFCWGGNRWGELGDGRSDTLPTGMPVFGVEAYETGAALRTRRAVSFSGSHRFSVVSAGDRHSCGVTTHGAVYCWGLGRFGQLGHGASTNSAVPVRAGTSERFRSVSAGVTQVSSGGASRVRDRASKAGDPRATARTPSDSLRSASVRSSRS
jgi:alpha-tubulin suppressor-like RCC1 family protein